jgi:DNA-binding PadR family transcriptional regulator
MANDPIHGHLDDLILAVLAGGPAHGYAVIQTLRAQSGGVLDLPEGSVYPALYRLERTGLLESDWAPGGARARRVYRITPRGLAALEQGKLDWRRFAAAVDAILRPSAQGGLTGG